MIYLAIITFTLVVISFFTDRKKTISGFKLAIKKFIFILIPILLVLVFVSVVLFFISEDMISKILSNGNKYIGVLIASVFGSITMVPGFIAFPLCGILKQNGISYMVISAFTTTLMMVGTLTLPVEKEYFGFKVALLRNIISFFIAIVTSLITGIFFGEIF